MGKIDVRPCILSGGAGNRLWPFSREQYPKQFLDLAGRGLPLLVDTVTRLTEQSENLSILTHRDLRFPTVGLLKKFKLNHVEVIGEPLRRNTAPAVALMVWLNMKKNPQSVTAIFPADHLIGDRAQFSAALRTACEKASLGNSVVVLGIQPTYPATGYGYIEIKDSPPRSTGPQLATALRFVEKPDEKKAQSFLDSGRFFWNAGIFFFQTAFMAQQFERLMPDMWKKINSIREDLSNLDEVYDQLPTQSFDFGIMEHMKSIDCVVCDPKWSDIGSWEEVAKESSATQPVLNVEAQKNTFLSLGARGKTVAFIGVSDLMVAETQDALLVMKKGQGQKVRDVVENLKKNTPKLIRDHQFEERPWGSFEVLLDEKDLKVKRIMVLPGERLSYQSHQHRDENWTVISGEAEVVLNEVIHKLKSGEHIFIPRGAKHRVSNPGKAPMIFVEVQTGTYFGEDDIVRYTDDYGRAK